MQLMYLSFQSFVKQLKYVKHYKYYKYVIVNFGFNPLVKHLRQRGTSNKKNLDQIFCSHEESIRFKCR